MKMAFPNFELDVNVKFLDITVEIEFIMPSPSSLTRKSHVGLGEIPSRGYPFTMTVNVRVVWTESLRKLELVTCDHGMRFRRLRLGLRSRD
jgi:hypothetical protein